MIPVNIIGGILIGVGVFFLQDGLASIAFYPKESCRWNHTARLVRIILGVLVVYLGFLLL